MVILGVSGGAAELGDEADRYGFHGSIMLLDSESGASCERSGRSPRQSGATDTPAGRSGRRRRPSARRPKYAYAATRNPFQPEVQHANTNAIVKFELDRSRGTFGTIVASYQGNVDEYFTQFRGPALHQGLPNAYPQVVGSLRNGSRFRHLGESDPGREPVDRRRRPEIWRLSRGVRGAFVPQSRRGPSRCPIGRRDVRQSRDRAGGNAPVTFDQHLEAGTRYGFYCSVHPRMRGTLLAV